MPYIYAPDALIYDAVANSWSLRPDYDPKLHRLEITFSDDDPLLEGDYYNDEVGSDPNQFADIRAWDGTPVISGQIYDEEFYEIRGPDGRLFYIDRLEIAGQHVGYVTTDVLQPGVSYPQTAISDVGVAGGVDNRLQYSDLQNIPCFLTGTEVMTQQGTVPVDWLRPGDRVLTRDRGFQPLLWVGQFEVGEAGLPLPPPLRPVEIAPGALGAGQPASALRVSPQHRVLLQGARLQLCFGHEAMFCAADFLTGWPGIGHQHLLGPAIYFHLLLPRHAAVLADGQWTESLFLGDQLQEILPPAEQAALRRKAGAAGLAHDVTAYPCLRRWEVALLEPPQAESDAPDLSRAWGEISNARA